MSRLKTLCALTHLRELASPMTALAPSRFMPSDVYLDYAANAVAYEVLTEQVGFALVRGTQPDGTRFDALINNQGGAIVFMAALFGDQYALVNQDD